MTKPREPLKVRLARSSGMPALLRRAHGRRPTIVARRAATAPVIDGKLDDPAWQRPADTLEFRSPGCDPMPLKVEGWITYDDTCCYVAIRSQEPRLDLLTCKVKERDAAVYSDDCVEFFLNVDREKNEYYQFVVNPAGVVYDSLRRDGSVNTSVKAAAGREAAAWTVELAIPWADVKVAPPLKGKQLGFLFSRTRPAKAKDDAMLIFQYPPLNGWNHRSENHGYLTLSE